MDRFEECNASFSGIGSKFNVRCDRVIELSPSFQEKMQKMEEYVLRIMNINLQSLATKQDAVDKYRKQMNIPRDELSDATLWKHIQEGLKLILGWSNARISSSCYSNNKRIRL